MHPALSLSLYPCRNTYIQPTFIQRWCLVYSMKPICVFFSNLGIAIVIYRIKWFHTGPPFYWVLLWNDRVRLVAKFKMLMFYYPSIRDFLICVVDYRISLEVWHVNSWRFKVDSSILQVPILIIKKMVKLPSVYLSPLRFSLTHNDPRRNHIQDGHQHHQAIYQWEHYSHL